MSFPGADDLLGGPNNPREPDEPRGVPLVKPSQHEFFRLNGSDRWSSIPAGEYVAYPVDEAAAMEDVIKAGRWMRALVDERERGDSPQAGSYKTRGMLAQHQLEAACDRLDAIRSGS